MEIVEAAAWADVIMFTMPGRIAGRNYKKKYVHDNIRGGALRSQFAHALTFTRPDRNQKPGIDDIMMAPQRPRPHSCRLNTPKAAALPCLVAVNTDPPAKKRWKSGLSYCRAIGGRAGPGIIETKLPRRMRKHDLFGRNRLFLCGGIVKLIRCGFETLAKPATSPKWAVFRMFARKTKLIVDLKSMKRHRQHGLFYLDHRGYGQYVSGPRIPCPTTETKRV